MIKTMMLQQQVYNYLFNRNDNYNGFNYLPTSIKPKLLESFLTNNTSIHTHKHL